MRINLGTIDPSKMTVLQAKILNQYVIENKKEGVFKPGKRYKLTIPNPSGKAGLITYRFKLRYTMSYHASARDSVKNGAEAFDSHQSIGSGAFGKLFKSKQSLASRYGMFYASEKNRVVKQMIDDKAQQTFVENEVACAKKIAYTHIKPLTVIEGEEKNTNLLTMKFLSGVTMGKLSHEAFTTDDRIHYSIEIFRAVQAVHDAKIIHLDIKPDNMMVDPTTRKVRMIDFGLSIELDIASSKTLDFTCGTKVYAAPEQLKKKPITYRADYHAAGVTVAEHIWGVTNLRAYGPIQTDQPCLYFEEGVLKGTDLKDDHPLNEDHRQKIITALQQLTEVDPNQRGNLRAVIKTFETIQYERRKEKLAQQYQAACEWAHMIGLQVKKACRKNQQALEEEIILRALEDPIFEDSSEPKKATIAIQELIETLEIDCFKGMTTKKEIVEKIGAIKKAFNEEYQRLREIKQEIVFLKNANPQMMVLHKWEEDIERSLRKFNDSPPKTLHDRMAFQSKWKKQSDEIDSQLVPHLELTHYLKYVLKNYILRQNPASFAPYRQEEDPIASYEAKNGDIFEALDKKQLKLTKHREKDVHDFLEIFDNALSYDQLAHSFKTKLKSMRRGWFHQKGGFFCIGQSTLAHQLEKGWESFRREIYAVYKSKYKSNDLTPAGKRL